MNKRSLSIPVVVLIAVVALVLGSFGTATAAGLTTKQVKKIAAKVVNKKASGLTVAKATTADAATTANTVTDNAITSAKIANGTIAKEDLAVGTVPTILTARVGSDGTLKLGSGAVSAVRTSLGLYDVTFNRNVEQCVHLSSIFSGNQADEYISDTLTVGAVVHVDVESPDTSGTQLDQGFTLAVICAS